MRRTGICGLAGLTLLLCLSSSAWSYTLELQYDSNANIADAYARKTSTGGVVEDIPGVVTGPGVVSQSATAGGSPALAGGGGTTRPAVVLTNHLDSTQIIINTFAAAGHTDSTYYEGYSQGYGESIFRFKIVSGPGESSRVKVTIGFGVSGSINLKQASDYNKLILQFGGLLRNFTNGNDLQIAGEEKTWEGSLVSTTYSKWRQVTLVLDTNKFYIFQGFLQVDASAYDFNFLDANDINFDAFVRIEDIKPVNISPAIFLLLKDP
jgi:hypothetical protein